MRLCVLKGVCKITALYLMMRLYSLLSMACMFLPQIYYWASWFCACSSSSLMVFGVFVCVCPVCVCLSSSSCRSLSQERSSTSSWTDLMSQPHKHKELANYCSLLQEHYHQCYVTGNTLLTDANIYGNGLSGETRSEVTSPV